MLRFHWHPSLPSIPHFVYEVNRNTEEKIQSNPGLLLMVIRLGYRNLESSMDLFGPFLFSHSETVRKIFAYLVGARKFHNSDLYLLKDLFDVLQNWQERSEPSISVAEGEWDRLLNSLIPFLLHSDLYRDGHAIHPAFRTWPEDRAEKNDTISVSPLKKKKLHSTMFSLRDSTVPTGRDIFKSCVPT